jgi:hypothetical protein
MLRTLHFVGDQTPSPQLAPQATNLLGLFSNDAALLPAALVCQGTGCLLRRNGRRRAKARVCLFRGGAGATIAAKLLSKDEARRIAANIAKLPDLLLGFLKSTQASHFLAIILCAAEPNERGTRWGVYG